jgi:hypothetical protein
MFNDLQKWVNRKSAKVKVRRRGNTKPTQDGPKRFRPVLEAMEERTLLAAHLSLAGTQALVANANVNASQNNSTNESEMEVDINPTNPLNVVGFVHNTSNLNQIQVFFSTDGGSTWTRRLITNTSGAGIINDGFGAGIRYDPTIKFDANGRLYVAYGINYSVLQANGTYSTASTRLVVDTSLDGGNTFTSFRQVDLQNNVFVAPVNGKAQMPTVGVDHWELATGASGPNTTTQAVYIAYVRFQSPVGMMIAGSRDGGATFTAPLAFNDAGNSGQDAFPAVGPNGQLYVTWDSGTQIFVDRDLDGLWSITQNFGTDMTVRNLNAPIDLYSVPADPARGIGTGPVVTVDRSGGVHNGRIYVAFVDFSSIFRVLQAPSDTDVFLVWSDDQGVTWTSQASTGNVQGTPSTDFLPSVDVDADTGAVDVAYYTTDGAPNNTQVNLRLATSINGGTSFQKANVTVQRSQASSMSYSGQFLEYIGLAVRNGTAQTFWAGNPGAVQGTFVSDTDAFSASVASKSAANTLTVTGDDGGVIRNDVITLRTSPSNSKFAQVIVNGLTQWVGLWASIGKVLINSGGGNDTINIENTVSGIPVTVNAGLGDDTVNVSSVAHDLTGIAGNMTLNGGGGRDTLFINDQAFASYSANYTITANSLQRSRPTRLSPSPTGLITYSAFANGVVINGSNQGNKYQVSGSPSFLMNLNTGLGADTVNILATTGPVTVNGQSGLDTVNIGSSGNARKIGKTLTVFNPGSYSAVTVDDSADGGAPTIIMYNNGILNGSYTVISGLATGGDILLHGVDLSSLMILAGTPANGSGNMFRIHDTPFSLTPGGLTTTVKTGGGPDTVTIDGTTGALSLDVQGAPQGRNVVIIGSTAAGVGLNGINGPINVTGNTGVVSDLTINDSTSTVAHEYVIGGNFIQRLDKARISYQQISNLGLTAGTQSDHIVVQDTMPQIWAGIGGTTIGTSLGDDRIDVSRTTGLLIINIGGHGVVTVGNATSSLDNIKGAIGVGPSGAGNAVTLNLDDRAATTPQQLDITPAILGASFQRSGAANIQAVVNPLASFNWFGGSGGNVVNVKALPATGSIFTMGDGGDLLNLGTTADRLFDNGILRVIGGAGADQFLIRDQATIMAKRYDLGVSQLVGSETVGTITAHPLNSITNVMNIRYEHVESVTLNAGGGGNLFQIVGTPAATSLFVNTGAGADMVDVGSNAVFGPANLLADMRGPLMLDGQGGVNQVTFNDQGTTTVENYTLATDQLRRVEATGVADDIAPISFAAFQVITLNMSSGGSTSAVNGSPAGSTVTVNGNPGGQNQFAVDASSDSILGTVILHGGNANADFAQYFDIGNAAPHTYTLTSTSVSRDGQAPVFLNGVFGTTVFASMVGGNTVNVNSVAFGAGYKIVAASGDHVTVGSLAPGLGGTLADILDQVNVVSYTPTDAVSLVFDDSGNTDATVTKHITFGKDFDGNVNLLGLTRTGFSWRLPLASSVTVRGGAANEIFSMQPFVADTPLTIVGGTGSNTLDYSSYVNYPGLVSWYQGEGNASDVTGANPGVLHDGVSFAPGMVGQAFSFDGVDGYVDLGNNPSLDIPGDFTAEAWVNYQDLTHAKYLLADFDATGTVSQGSLGIQDDHFFWYQSMTDGSSIQPSGATTLVPGQWYHVAVVRDDVAKTVTLYVNGAVDGSASYSGTVVGLQQTKVLGTSEPLGFPDDFFHGAIDEPSIYNRALSAAELQAIFTAGSAGKPVQAGVDVNLQTGTATGLAGISDPDTGRITIQNVIGSSADDTLTAGADRSILIGGAGADQLFGGSGEAILIAGTTDYTQPNLNVAALDAILQEWNRTDLGFDDRMSDLINGSNSQGIAATNVSDGTLVLLSSNTVHDDLAADILTGGTGRDWYFIDHSDLITNIKLGDVVTTI